MFIIYPVVFEGLDPILSNSVNTIVSALAGEAAETENSSIVDNDGVVYTNADEMKSHLTSGGLLMLKEDEKVIYVLEYIDFI